MVNKVLTHENYKDSLFQGLQMKHKMTTIQAENHELFTVELEKKSLSPFNDKKWITREDDNFICYNVIHLFSNRSTKLSGFSILNCPLSSCNGFCKVPVQSRGCPVIKS